MTVVAMRGGAFCAAGMMQVVGERVSSQRHPGFIALISETDISFSHFNSALASEETHAELRGQKTTCAEVVLRRRLNLENCVQVTQHLQIIAKSPPLGRRTAGTFAL